MQLINVGCGHRIHPDWCNLDLQAAVPGVIEHDLRHGLPFEVDSCDAVYHSHVLEHLTRADGERLLAQCFRVLKPGGVLRVVVPDLEQIAREYLASLARADADRSGLMKVEWMKMEMIDQMVRTRGGGEMLQFATHEGKSIEPFIRSRLGDEIFGGKRKLRTPRRWHERLRRGCRKTIAKAQQWLALAAVTVILGPSGRRALGEGLFRQSGETHQWMYDRLTLEQTLIRVGFENPAVHRADTSQILRFNEFELDMVEGRVRKPDSLFIEAVKPLAVGRASKTHSKAA